MRHFGTLPEVANWLKRTHCTFAGIPWKDEWLSILGSSFRHPMVVGATYTGFIFNEDVELNTFIHIDRTPEGGWLVSESTKNLWED